MSKKKKKIFKESAPKTSKKEETKTIYQIIPLEVDDYVMINFEIPCDVKKSENISNTIRQIKEQCRVLGSSEAGKIKGFIIHKNLLSTIREKMKKL